MRSRMKLGDFLVAYLKKIGTTHLFGIPGDLVLKLFLQFARPKGLKIITLSHEPGVGFAADAYARASGRIGVVCVTYGAGGFNIMNPLAGSFSEKVPILVISGGPGEDERKLGQLIHHQAKEIESQFKVFSEVTCAARVIDDPETAARDIDAVIRSIWMNRRPGYLEIHRDMVDQMVPVPADLRDGKFELPEPQSDQRKVVEAARETAERFNRAKKPLLMIGIEVHRYKLMRRIVDLAEKMGAPVMTTVLGKGAFPTDHPLHMGVHVGPLSPPPLRKRVDGADLVINLGTLLTDMNLGSQPPVITRGKSIWAVDNKVNVSFHTYTEVNIRDFVRALMKCSIKRHRETVTYVDNLPKKRASAEKKLRVADLLSEINAFLEKRDDYMVVAESGDSLFAGLEIRAPGGMYLAQGYYASMGFAVPGSLGAQLGCKRRPLVLCGDGGFQMTGPEIAQAPRYGLNPVVVLLNNGGWGIFRPVTARPDLLEIPAWPYAELAKSWGGSGFSAETIGEFRGALKAAAKGPGFAIIECRIGPKDLSPISVKYIKGSVRRK
ncbi:MAG: thiamine pyrophosphate-binding protein [Deltaproteobacteria bacterium]|nr:thiamine pyrophosphate-binding protein [Deltaproteobacteria bacterium]